MIIGRFQTAAHGYSGHIETIAIDAMIAIIPAQPSDSERAPQWRVLLGDADSGIDIGAGWDCTGERAGSFIALQIEDPSLAAPLRANLLRSGQNPDEHNLLWTRPSARESK